MLINISNHPSEKWSAEQRDSAIAQFGGPIVDWAHPNIDPNALAEEVRDLALNFALRVENEAAAQEASEMPDQRFAVHVVGEPQFCFHLVDELRSNGYIVVAATSERLSVENADGTKTVDFRFAQFRRY